MTPMCTHQREAHVDRIQEQRWREHIRKRGYAGIVVTDHFFYGNTAVDRSLPWKDWVEQFCKGYEHAKEEGDKIGLQVFFGWESGYHGTEFLIYGLNKEWLFEHPETKTQM